MDNGVIDGFSVFLKAVLDLGAIGVMAFGLWAFLKGKIVSEKRHEEALLSQREADNKTLDVQREASEMAAKIVSQELCQKLEDGVAKGIETGIVKGYLKVNGGPTNP